MKTLRKHCWNTFGASMNTRNTRTTLWHFALLALALMLLVSCSDDASVAGGGGSNVDAGNTSSNNTADGGNGEEDSSSEEDTGGNTGEDVPDDGLLNLGDFCTDGPECRSNLCFQLDGSEQGFCSQFCLRQEDCPGGGFDCIFVENEDDEIARVCVPLDFCIDNDNDQYGVGPGCNGRDCDDTNADRNPGATEICDSIDNDCDGQVDDDPVDANIECETGIPGICSEGLVQCLFGELTCETVRFASREVCDNVDNDCDGFTDEGDDGEPLNELCYSGSNNTADVGICATGARVCQGGQFSLCQGEVLPLIELCDGADNDCDGNIDEGMPETGLDCNTDGMGICRQGQTLCNEGGEIVCIGVTTPAEEVCDGVDNDCDGFTDEDENDEPMARNCYDGDEGTADVGACQSGVQTCVDGTFGVCDGQVLPRDELCDEIDNDCDDELNEDNPAGGQICSTNLLGECNEGETICGDGGLECSPLRMATEEICDNKDNDCDGEVDEGDIAGETLSQECYTGTVGTEGQGPCTSGTRTCVGGVFTSCQGQVLPETEVCDGLDNDCDGVDDNSPQSVGNDCPTGLMGACGVGRNVCRAGELLCEAEIVPADEVCNGLDDDCDGFVDEDPDNTELPLRQACYNGPDGTAGTGSCRAGVQTCTGGRLSSCVGEVRPATVELCNGEDDDCDDDIDEDAPGSGFACSVPETEGICGNGTTICANGVRICLQQIDPLDSEICNGLDDDCDGEVDEDANGQPLSQTCYDGEEGTAGTGSCREGRRLCVGGVFSSCQDQVLPSDDLCNDGIDNDCNGIEDDGDPEEGQVCSTGMGGICAQGIKVCGDEGIVCQPTNMAQPTEVCNGLDDDCDGEVDESANGQPLSQTCYGGQPGTAGVGICRMGNQVCQGGQFTSCQDQVLPQTELCDGIDNDCNGIDDDNLAAAEVDVPCTTDSPGICAPGLTACTDGEIVCAANMTSQPELCDGIDNDCNGALDNGFDGLGDNCFVGAGICQRAGVFICNGNAPAGDPVCDATAGVGNATELCDYLDDDCDSQVDELFTNGAGIYDRTEHCGGCDVNCNNRWPDGPAAVNVAPLCRVIGNNAQCDFTCVGDYIDIDEVPDNGCEFLPDAGAVYVATPANSGSDTGTCGAYNTPCATIDHALTRAQLVPAFSRLRVSSGQYRENVQLVEGIDVLGGHNPTNWSRNPAIFVTAIVGSTSGAPANPDRMAVTATNINSATELSGFTINAENAALGGNSIGVYALNSTSALVIRDNVVFGGTGGNGTVGAPGNSGDSATALGNGNTGSTSDVCNTNQSCPRAGGTGGSLTCDNPSGGVSSVAGGMGGTSTDAAVFTQSGPGVTGSGPSGGLGGQAAANALGTFFNNVFNCDFAGNAEPEPGNPGNPGVDGSGGNAASSIEGALNTALLQWRGNPGSDGTPGTHGSGGGGGGAAGGADATDINQDGAPGPTAEVYWGAGGGGGGAGGCAAFAGNGGNPGGGSFAVVIAFSAGNAPGNANGMPSLTNNILIRGIGGLGGRGGDGGAGGDPGLGGIGGNGIEDSNDNFDFCMADGAVGAEGGRGGHAGGGAGGNGGASYDIYVGNDNGVNPNYAANNTFVLNSATDTAGTGGAGGSSSTLNNGAGDTGNSGAFGNVLSEP